MSQSRTNPLHLDPNAATLCATLRAFTLLPTHTMMYCYGSLLCCKMLCAGGRLDNTTGVAIIRLRSPDAKGLGKGHLQAPQPFHKSKPSSRVAAPSQTT